MAIGDYAVEHFVPYGFVSHDLLWNLIPADKSFNSSKCDKLHSLSRIEDSKYVDTVDAIELESFTEIIYYLEKGSDGKWKVIHGWTHLYGE